MKYSKTLLQHLEALLTEIRRTKPTTTHSVLYSIYEEKCLSAKHSMMPYGNLTFYLTVSYKTFLKFGLVWLVRG